MNIISILPSTSFLGKFQLLKLPTTKSKHQVTTQNPMQQLNSSAIQSLTQLQKSGRKLSNIKSLRKMRGFLFLVYNLKSPKIAYFRHTIVSIQSYSIRLECQVGFQLNLVSLKFSTESKPIAELSTGGTTYIKGLHSF